MRNNKNLDSIGLIPGLDALEALRRQGTLAQAAQTLHIEASSVWKRIKVLEAACDFALIRKRGRNTEITAEAKELLDSILPDYNRILSKIHELGYRSPADITIRVGVSDSVLLSWGASYLRKLASDAMPVHLEISSAPGPQLLENLKQGKLDLVLAAGKMQEAPLLFKKIREEAVCLCWAKEAKTQKLSSVAQIFSIESGSLSFDLIDGPIKAILAKEGFKGIIKYQHNYANIAALIADGWAPGFVPEGIAERFGLQMQKKLNMQRPIFLYYKKGLLQIPAMEKILTS